MVSLSEEVQRSFERASLVDEQQQSTARIYDSHGHLRSVYGAELEPGELSSRLASLIPEIPALLAPERVRQWTGSVLHSPTQTLERLTCRVDKTTQLRLHRIHGADQNLGRDLEELRGEEDHEHPWSFATAPLQGAYLMSVDGGAWRNVAVPDMYEMHPGTRHAVIPITGPVISAVLTTRAGADRSKISLLNAGSDLRVMGKEESDLFFEELSVAVSSLIRGQTT